MKQKAEITFEIEETLVVRQPKETVTAVCPICMQRFEKAFPNIPASINGFAKSQILQLIEDEVLHSVINDDDPI